MSPGDYGTGEHELQAHTLVDTALSSVAGAIHHEHNEVRQADGSMEAEVPPCRWLLTGSARRCMILRGTLLVAR